MKYGIIQRSVSVDDVTLTTNGQGQIEVKGTFLDSYIENRVDDVTLRINAEDKLEIKPNNRNIQILNINKTMVSSTTFTQVASMTITKTGKYLVQLSSILVSSSTVLGTGQLLHNSTVLRSCDCFDRTGSGFFFANIMDLEENDVLKIEIRVHMGGHSIVIGGNNSGTGVSSLSLMQLY